MGRLRLFLQATIGALAIVLVIAIPADAATSDWTVPFTATVANPCVPETVSVTGKLHMVTISSDSKDEVTTNWADTTGIGLTTGSLYQADNTSHTYILARPAGQLTLGLRDDMELVTKDPTQNFIVHQLLQLTVDATTFDVIDVKITPDGTKCVG